MNPSPDNFPAAIMAMMVGVSLAAGMDAVGKILLESLSLGVMQVSWGRFMFHTLWLTPAVLLLRRKTFSGKITARTVFGHGGRGLLLMLSTLCFFAAIRDNPIPDTLALFSVQPLVVILLAALFLGERLYLRRVLAGGIAFVGVLVVLYPGLDGGGYRWTIGFALLAAVCFAAYIIATRLASIRGSPLTATWAAGVGGLIFSTPFAAVYWHPPGEQGWLLLGLLGLFAAAGHYCITLACRLANASFITIFQHTEIIATTIISYFVFKYVPDTQVWAGFALIAGAKIGLTLMEIKFSSGRRKK